MTLLSFLDLGGVIRSLWRQLQENNVLLWENPNHALYVQVHMMARHLGYEADGNTHHPEYEAYANAWVQVLVTSQHRCYVAHTVDHVWKVDQVPAEAWVNISNHDSCWHSNLDNELTRIYFGLCAKIQEPWADETKTHPILKPAPRDIDVGATIGDWLGANPLQFAVVTRGAKRPGNDYFDSLSAVNPLAFKMTLEEIPEQETAKSPVSDNLKWNT